MHYTLFSVANAINPPGHITTKVLNYNQYLINWPESTPNITSETINYQLDIWIINSGACFSTVTASPSFHFDAIPFVISRCNGFFIKFRVRALSKTSQSIYAYETSKHLLSESKCNITIIETLELCLYYRVTRSSAVKSKLQPYGDQSNPV